MLRFAKSTSTRADLAWANRKRRRCEKTEEAWAGDTHINCLDINASRELDGEVDDGKVDDVPGDACLGRDFSGNNGIEQKDIFTITQ